MAMEMETCKLNFDNWVLFQKKELKKIEIIEIRKIIRNNWNCTLCNWHCCKSHGRRFHSKWRAVNGDTEAGQVRYLAQGCLHYTSIACTCILSKYYLYRNSLWRHSVHPVHWWNILRWQLNVLPASHKVGGTKGNIWTIVILVYVLCWICSTLT